MNLHLACTAAVCAVTAMFAAAQYRAVRRLGSERKDSATKPEGTADRGSSRARRKRGPNANRLA